MSGRLPRLGVGLQKLTTAQRDAISSPATGLVIYNTTTNLLNVYDGTSWGTVMPTVDTAGEGYFYAPYGPTAGSNTAALASNNQVRVQQFVLSFRVLVANLAFRIAAASAGGLAGVGMYDKDKNKLFALEGVDTTATGVKTGAVSPSVTLEPGVYYVAWTGDNTTVLFNGGSATTPSAQILNAIAAKVGNAANTSSSGVLPATLGTITGAVLAPAILMIEP